MKSHYKFTVFVILIIACAMASQMLLRQNLPNFKGLEEHEEIMNSQSFFIDRDIILSAWKNYSKSLPRMASINDEDTRKREKKVMSMLLSYTTDQMTSLDQMISSMQLDKEKNLTVYLKDYLFQTQNQESYLINYISSNRDKPELLYYHIEPQSKTIPTQKQKQLATEYMNKINTYGINDDNENIFIDINKRLQEILRLNDWQYILPLTNENVMNPHFYTMEYDNELLLIFQSELLDLNTLKINKTKSNLILFYNIIEEKFSGFMLQMV